MMLMKICGDEEEEEEQFIEEPFTKSLPDKWIFQSELSMVNNIQYSKNC